MGCALVGAPTGSATLPVQAAAVPASAPVVAAHPAATATAVGGQVQAAIQATMPGSTAGVEVIDLSTGTVLAEENSTNQFFAASVAKLLIALDVLHAQQWHPDSTTQNAVHKMLAFSDDDTADTLWDNNGSYAIVARMASLIGLTGTTAPADSDEWGETLTTAADVVSIYRYLTTTIPQPARDIVLTALRDAAKTATDGTDQYFGIPDGLPGQTWAIKQGWMSLDSSTTLNTTGLVGTGLRYIVVVLTTQPEGISWNTGGSALTAGVAALRNTLGS